MLFNVSVDIVPSINTWKQLIQYFIQKSDKIVIQSWNYENEIRKKIKPYNFDHKTIGNITLSSINLTSDLINDILILINESTTIEYFSIFLSRKEKTFFYAEHYGKEYHILDINNEDLEFIKSIIPTHHLNIEK